MLNTSKIFEFLCREIFLSEPTAAPVNVRGHNTSSTSILVEWDDVPDFDQNGIITSYNITYRSQTENHNGFAMAGPNDLQKNLTDLREYVDYNITVRASTSKGDGPDSNLTVVRTDQDSKYFFFLNVLFMINVLHPNICMHILHTVPYTSDRELVIVSFILMTLMFDSGVIF